MKNKLAKQLKKAADEYLEDITGPMMMVARNDYEDLLSIAQMIENNESSEAIQKAMWKLDTLVRDVIPDSVYYHYNPKK